MVNVVIERIYTNYNTLGDVTVFTKDGRTKKYKSVELPDKGNQRNISCIPEGKYQYKTLANHAKFGACIFLPSVRGRSGIYSHRANWHYQLRGCIAIGQKHVQHSTANYTGVNNSTASLREIVESIEKVGTIEIKKKSPIFTD